LRNLGHGIEQLLIFACAMTLATPQNPVVLFEEPEVGLHPRILRQFLNVLTEEKDSQFFLTTHSNHLVDFVHDNVKCFHLRKTQTGPQVESTDGPTLQMLSDLGVRSSSLMQANAVLWVEGPSDAMYIRTWLEVFGGNHKLTEHVDYTFAFFGGALLKHYSVEPDGTKQVALNPIHPGWFFIADSDRLKPTDPLKKTYLNEFATRAGNERLWITKGKEIESYLNDNELRNAFRATEPFEKVAPEHDGYESLAVRLARLGIAGSHAESKVALARKVLDTNQFTTDRQDLKASIEKVLTFISNCSKGVVP
jgi:AAA domain, putative AbiEii toxin, Type IV TA system